MTWIEQDAEWNKIKDELIDAWEKAGKPFGKEPSAHSVTTEQRKRMLAEGRHYMDHDDALAELNNNGGKFIGQENT